jgi:hypothetical protein
MLSFRGLVAMLLILSLCDPLVLGKPGADPPLGILTRAYAAHLNDLPAFPGLSVFDDERLSTEASGKLGLRVGGTALTLSSNTASTLHRINGGLHVDMTSGSLFFASPENAIVEVHAEGALLRPAKNQLTQAEVWIFAAPVLQVTALRGDLALSYREEFRVIPEGETYRVYLDSPSDSQNPAGSRAPPARLSRKVVIFIIAGGAAVGLTAWGIHELIESSNGPESPAKP